MKFPKGSTVLYTRFNRLVTIAGESEITGSNASTTMVLCTWLEGGRHVMTQALYLDQLEVAPGRPA